MRPIQCFVLASIALLLCGVGQAQEARLLRVAVSIEKQPLRDALRQFADQTGLQVILREEEVSTDGLTAPRLAGEFSVEQALSRLLSPAGLTYEFINARTVSIRPAPIDKPVSQSDASQAQEARAVHRWMLAQAGLGTAPPAAAEPVEKKANTASERSESSLAEVVVSAQKRNESLQEVPMSITAITAETMVRAGIDTFIDYATKIPNLTFSYGQGQGVLESRAIAIRGIQGADTTGFYIDDLPLPTTMDPRVMDLQRIEVLRGPQGTLYGASSMGGTVRMITTPPDLRMSSAQAHAEASSVDGGGNGGQVDATFNMPLGERLAARLTTYVGTEGGFINRNYPMPGGGMALIENEARTHFHGANASLLWNVTDNFSIRPMVMFQKSNANGLPEADIRPDNLTDVRTWNVPESMKDRWSIGGVSMNYSTSIGEFTSATSVFARQAHELEDVSEFTSAAFGVPPILSGVDATNSRHSFVEELRYASPASEPLQFVGGVYYARQTLTFAIVQDVPGLDAASGGAFGSNLIIDAATKRTQKQLAGFGEFTYHLTSQWSATLGARYSRNDYQTRIAQVGILAAGQPPVVTADGNDNGTTPKAVLKYAPNANLDYYLVASKGFRLGGAQIAPPPGFNPGGCGADYASSGLSPEQLQSYKSDSLWNYEIGAKSRLLNQRLTLNVAAFQIDWSDIQQILRFTCGFSTVINSGRARSRGGELELSAMPLDHWNLTLGVGYTDSKILEPGALIEFPKAGTAIQNVAPWTVSFSSDYSFPLGEGYRGMARVDYAYNDRSFSANNDRVTPRPRDAYGLLNLRFGVMRNAWTWSAFVKNVSNTHANLGDAESQAAEAPDRPRFLINTPRTYGLEMRVQF